MKEPPFLPHARQRVSYIEGLTAVRLAFFMGFEFKKSGAMVFILNLDKVSLKKLFPTMNI